jgi:sigma-B regulation protein RsbU (phosphoserine phosphatase)
MQPFSLRATREPVYVNAGHCAPFLIRRTENHSVWSDWRPADRWQVYCLPQGHQEQRCILEPGDLLLAYTDGISEAMTENNE